MTSIHYMEERSSREDLINKIGLGNFVTQVIIDKGHKNEPERHVLTNTGIIVIYNLYTNKMVTKLIARPGQLKRFKGVPQYLIQIVKEHQKEGYNI